MPNPKLQRTKNYSQFTFTKENRDVNVQFLRPQHRKLRESMAKYGFLPAFPIMARAVNGKFVIMDGQNRFTFAKELGLDVFFVVDNTEVCISELNEAQATWTTIDYAKRWAAAGRKDYTEALLFSEEYAIPIGLSFAMLASTTHFANIKNRFRSGDYKIKSQDLALRVALIHQKLVCFNKKAKNVCYVYGLWACCNVDYFDKSRILQTSRRRPEMLAQCGKTEIVLEVLEEIYNFNRQVKMPLKFDAQQAMLQRSVITRFNAA